MTNSNKGWKRYVNSIGQKHPYLKSKKIDQYSAVVVLLEAEFLPFGDIKNSQEVVIRKSIFSLLNISESTLTRILRKLKELEYIENPHKNIWKVNQVQLVKTPLGEYDHPPCF